jgi:hypothetical protein
MWKGTSPLHRLTVFNKARERAQASRVPGIPGRVAEIPDGLPLPSARWLVSSSRATGPLSCYRSRGVSMATDFVFFLIAILMVVALIGLLVWFFFLWER